MGWDGKGRKLGKMGMQDMRGFLILSIDHLNSILFPSFIQSNPLKFPHPFFSLFFLLPASPNLPIGNNLSDLYNQVMIKRGVLTQLSHSFFNFTKKAPPEVKQASPKPKNKRYLVDAILEANKLKPKLLPPPANPSKLTVVLEMDEVLAFTFTPDEEGYLMAPRRKEDFHLWFEEYECLLNIYKRKNLDNFLSYLSEECEPVVFSAGVKSYVELVMSLIDPARKIKHIITQQHCDRILEEESDIDQYVKDLNLLGRDMSQVVYIDSKPMSFWLHPDNGMCCEQFKADNTMKYEDLDDLLLQIEQCRKYKDLRQYLLKQYSLRQDFEQSNLL